MEDFMAIAQHSLEFMESLTMANDASASPSIGILNLAVCS